MPAAEEEAASAGAEQGQQENTAGAGGREGNVWRGLDCGSAWVPWALLDMLALHTRLPSCAPLLPHPLQPMRPWCLPWTSQRFPTPPRALACPRHPHWASARALPRQQRVARRRPAAVAAPPSCAARSSGTSSAARAASVLTEGHLAWLDGRCHPGDVWQQQQPRSNGDRGMCHVAQTKGRRVRQTPSGPILEQLTLRTSSLSRTANQVVTATSARAERGYKWSGERNASKTGRTDEGGCCGAAAAALWQLRRRALRAAQLLTAQLSASAGAVPSQLGSWRGDAPEVCNVSCCTACRAGSLRGRLLGRLLAADGLHSRQAVQASKPPLEAAGRAGQGGGGELQVTRARGCMAAS